MSVSLKVRTNVSGIGSGGQPQINKVGKLLQIYLLLTLTNGATSYLTGGETCDLTTIFGSTGLPGYSFPTASLPEKVEFKSSNPTASAQTNLFVYNYVPGTTLANGKVQVFTGAASQTALTELGAGAYPAGVLADVIEGTITIPVP